MASVRGKTGKSTARMESAVMSSMCALYVVSAGNGVVARARGALGLSAVGAMSIACDGEGGREGGPREGRGEP